MKDNTIITEISAQLMSLAHPEESVNGTASEEYQCDVCGKCYASVYTLKRHKESVHGQQIDCNKNASKCCLCTSVIKTRNHLLKHLQSAHNIVVLSEVSSFSSMNDFKT